MSDPSHTNTHVSTEEKIQAAATTLLSEVLGGNLGPSIASWLKIQAAKELQEFAHTSDAMQEDDSTPLRYDFQCFTDALTINAVREHREAPIYSLKILLPDASVLCGMYTVANAFTTAIGKLSDQIVGHKNAASWAFGMQTSVPDYVLTIEQSFTREQLATAANANTLTIDACVSDPDPLSSLLNVTFSASLDGNSPGAEIKTFATTVNASPEEVLGSDSEPGTEEPEPNPIGAGSDSGSDSGNGGEA